jgi:hypothetical protein
MNHLNQDGKDVSGTQKEIALLHMYEHHSNHMETYVVGNRSGLEKLRDAINESLAGDGDQTVSMTPSDDCVFVTDGEGYEVFVIRNDSAWDGPVWNKLATPYTAEECQYRPEDAKYPHELLTEADKDRFYPNRSKS